MSFFAKPGPAICLLPLSRGRHREISPPVCRCPVGKQKLWIASGYRYPSQRSLSPARRFPENDPVSLPEIQLVFSILFFVEKRRVVLFPEGRRKFSDHFLSHLVGQSWQMLGPIQAVTSAGSVPYSFSMADRTAWPMRFTVPLQPEWARPMALLFRSRKYSGTHRQKMSPASRRAGL